QLRSLIPLRRESLHEHHRVYGIEFRAQTREKQGREVGTRVSSFDVQTTNRFRLQDRRIKENF
ncbi:unnamed protein product, partial [Linum tenue]